VNKTDALKRFFGHSAFREGQEMIIDALLGGRDALGVMPTGGGKSICYQLPAVMLEGMALVVSPLISLMGDQVMALRENGVRAAYVNSSLSSEQFSAVYRNMRAGKYKIVYVAPERLGGEGFAALARELEISLVAVDEAHCVSQWGQDFRPSYLKIIDFLEKLPRRPAVAAFTATATSQVRGDIERILQLRDPLRVTTGFDRPNLNFEVTRPANKTSALMELLARRRGQCGIVYCATRASVEKVYDALLAKGFTATRYHAGMPDDERRRSQEDFLYDRSEVMVATNAFGMGIDKSNVGFVIHYNMPKSIEAYYQEAGRAGRDGGKADCVVLYSAGDVYTAKYLIRNSGENEELTELERASVIRRDMERLDAMAGYCKTTGCLRGYILEYFAQEHAERCGDCGNCRAQYATRDITAQAQMILSCVKRAEDMLGYCVGASLIARVLCGGADKRIRELGLDTLTTYGLMRGTPSARAREMLEYLEERGFLRTDPEHGGVALTARAGDVLFRHESVEMPIRETPPAERRRGSAAKAAAAPALTGDESGLLAALKALRYSIAKREGVPAYIIFSNACLQNMAALAPANMAQFLQVSGVGEIKASRYGEAFLREINAFSGKT
jgi:ATP-dependent DNA helicase RecQ